MRALQAGSLQAYLIYIFVTLLALLIFATSTALLCFGKLTGSEWISVIPLVYGSFVVGNVAQRAVEAKADAAASP